MDVFGTGAGLAALGFWLFVATMFAIGVWNNIKKRESQHETLRRIVESGQPIDDDLTDKLLSITGGSTNRHLDRDLRVGGYIMLALAPGLTLLGLAMGYGLAIELLWILLGVAGLMLCLSIGMFVASNVIRSRYGDEVSGSPA